MNFNEVNIVTIICSVADGFGLLVSCIFLYLVVYHLYAINHEQKNSDKDMPSSLKYYGNTSAICFSISSLCIFTYTIISQTDNSSFYLITIRTTGGMSICAWGLAKWGLSFIFVNQLYLALEPEKTIYSLPQSVFTFLKIILAFIPFCIILATISFLRYPKLFIYFGIFIFIADVLWNLLIFHLFYSKLKKIVIDQRLRSSAQNTAHDDILIVQTMGRLTFLTIISLIMALCLGIIMVCRAVIEIKEINNVSAKAYFVYTSNCILMASCMANNIIIYFLFRKDSYEKHCKKTSTMFTCMLQ